MSDAALLDALLAAVLCAVVLLLASLATGLLRRRRAHLVSVALFIPGLFTAVFLAERYGRRFTFDPVWLEIHLSLAWSAVISLAGPVVSGLLSLKRVRPHPAHRILALLFTALAVAAVVTGTIMIAGGRRI
ncbi:MAG: hypothetical protein JNM84_11575 [Planctomycetes bacterium]|nr:hypothetical protein [Planctomycetota bacterium]